MKPRIFHYYSKTDFDAKMNQAWHTKDRATQVLLGKLEARFRRYGVTAYLFPSEQKRLEAALQSPETIQLELEIE